MTTAIRKMLLDNISFAYNEAIEFIVSMGMTACEGELVSMAEDYKIEMDPLASAFHEDAGIRLSPHAYRELQFFFKHNFYHKALDFAFYQSICTCPEPQTAEGWIDRLEESPAERVVAEMVYGVYHDKLDALLEGNDWEVVKKDIQLMSELVAKTEPQPEVISAHGPLLECLAFPEEAKLRYMQLLRQFYGDVFVYWKDRLRAESDQAALRYEAQFLADPLRFIREIHKNEPALFDSPAAFHISFVAQVGNDFLNFYTEAGRVGWVIFGVHNDRVYGPAADREKIELFLKAFSDKRRLDLLLLLKKRPYYGQELAAALGITPAAVNYHANFFFFLDLIEIIREDHRLYYHLRRDKLQELLALTTKVMLDED